MKKVWVFKFRESGDEDDVVVFDSKPSRDQLFELYEMAKKIDPDTASVIFIAEDTLRKSK